MSSGVSLYYPYMHILNESWLKRSLLYWDQLRRIVPDGVRLDHYEDCYWAREEGLLVATSPTPYLPKAAQRFRAKIPALVEEVRHRGESFGVDDPESATQDPDRRIHLEKIEPALRRFLVDQQIAQLEGDWMVSHPDVADWYMTCLATVMSEQIGSPVVTDLQKNNAIGEYLTHANPASAETSSDRDTEMLRFRIPSIEEYLTHANPASAETSSDRGTAMLRLRIPFPDAEAVARVPLREILEFREKYADERRNLRSIIEDLMKDVHTISDKNELSDHLNDKQSTLDKAIKEHRRAADRFYVKTLPTVLQISAPAGPMALATLLGAPPLTVAVLGAGSVALLAVCWWAKFKDDEAAVKAKPYQYLLSLEQRFGSNA
jgi:hypothetical protein